MLILFCACGLFGGVVGTYIHTFNRQLTEENSSRLAEVSDAIVTHLTTVITDTQTMLHAVARGIDALDSEKTRLAYLRDVARLYSFAYMGYAGSDGLLHATVPTESVDLSGDPSFRAALQGKASVSEQVRKIFATRAVSGVVLTVPLERKGEKGALVAMLETRRLRDGLKLENFGRESRTYIIDKQGAVIMRARHVDFGNLFIALHNKRFPEDGRLRLLEAVRQGRQRLDSFIDVPGNRQYIYCQPLRFNNWTAVTIVPQQAVLSDQAVTLTRELALAGAGLVLLFMGLSFWAMRAHFLSQESRMAMDAKSAFLANMSHEIRTPMNVIVGLSELMLRDKMPPAQRDRLASILNAGKGLLTIIDDILDITKIEAGKFSIVEEPYELETLFEDVTTIAAMRLGNKPVLFWLELDPALPRGLLGDMGRVKQVLLNIIGNAIKFTERGSVRLIVGGQQMGDIWHLRMEVRDSGIGIRAEDIDKLFISFNQVDTKRNRYIKGTGLGLAISKKLCEMMGGYIEVSSVYGKGSSFVATVRQRVDDPAPLVVPVPDNVSLLICEEYEDLRLFEAACLNQLKVRHTLCASPEDFLGRLREGSHTHALAPRPLLRGLDEKGVRLIGLLSLQEQMLMDMDGTNVYIPLFALQLPQALSTGAPSRLRGRSGLSVSEMEPLPHVSILIVDDNEVNVQVAEGLMAPYGMRMDHVYGGADAIRAVRERDYDLVFMDHMMPDMDGVEAVRHIRALPEEKYRTLPIIALTANVTVETRRMFLANGFNGFLPKPIETGTLNRLLRAWLKDLNARRAAATPEPHHPRPETESTAFPLPHLEERAPCDAAPPAAAQTPAQAEKAAPLPEVDFEAGTQRVPPTLSYPRLLALYVRSTGDTLDALPGWMNQDPDRVVIEVHGLKSASLTIGADHFSEEAKHLELLGRSGDWDELRAALPAFLAHGRRVLLEIEAFLASREKSGKKSKM